jgi:hypothetical protein
VQRRHQIDRGGNRLLLCRQPSDQRAKQRSRPAPCPHRLLW